MNPPRICALCGIKIKFKERLCPVCQEEWKNDLTSSWMRGIINYSEYQYNLGRRDTRNRVVSMEGVPEGALGRGNKVS